MKTSIKTLVATGLMTLALSASTVYANSNYGSTTVSASAVSIASIKKLIVSGNIEVTIVQNPKSKVLYANEGTEDVSVKKVGGSLYVNSKTNIHGAKITVYVDDIYRIEASNNAVIYTDDVLNLKYLQVFAEDNAKVNLNAKTENLLTTIKNTSKIKLKGATELYTVDMDKSSRIALDKFNSKKTVSNSDVYIQSRS